MADNSFFDEQSEQSQVKSTIVAKYFTVWANVIISSQKRYSNHTKKIAYIDLFAGPGRYSDGTHSTPIKILTTGIDNPEIGKRLVAVFNDKDEQNTHALEKEIRKLSGIEKLKYVPIVHNYTVGAELVKMFDDMKLVPTLFFVDPWGYKGLSLGLVNSVLKDWGCDCIFFFNYNRINMGMTNPIVREHMNELFGEERADQLRKIIPSLRPAEREQKIIEELCQAIKGYGNRYVLPFRFKNADGQRTSHHLIFVSKHALGYQLMKEIMATESSSSEQNVPSFEYNPADLLPQQSLLFQFSRPLEDLRNMLLEQFAGQTITRREIYEKHNIDTPYVKKNYQEVLKGLFDKGLIEAQSKKGKPPRKGTFGEDIIVTFPTKG